LTHPFLLLISFAIIQVDSNGKGVFSQYGIAMVIAEAHCSAYRKDACNNTANGLYVFPTEFCRKMHF